MFSNQKRHTSDEEEICVPASCKDNSSDNTDSRSGMVGGFSLQSRTTQKSTGLRFTPPASSSSSSSPSFLTPKSFHFNPNPQQSLY